MAQLNIRPAAEPPLLRIEPFKGLNLTVTPTQIDDHQSPDMLNLHTDERGALTKRTGYKRIIPTSIGPGAINGMFLYRKQDGSEQFLFTHGTKLYKTEHIPDDGTVQPTRWTDDELDQAWG